MRDMFDDAIQGKSLPFRSVAVDSWYAAKALMMHIDIGCAILAWHCLTKLARKLKTNIYALKNSLLSEYMKGELKNPSMPFVFA
jgi:hypothetical protein